MVVDPERTIHRTKFGSCPGLPGYVRLRARRWVLPGPSGGTHVDGFAEERDQAQDREPDDDRKKDARDHARSDGVVGPRSHDFRATTADPLLQADMARSVKSVLVMLACCGDVPVPIGADATGSPDAPELDADLRACDLNLPFGNLRPVPGIATSNGEINPSLSRDELNIYFFSNRQSPGTADFDVYAATRPTRDAMFGPAGPLTAVNTTSDERGGSLSPDGRALFFHSSRTGEYDLYVATRTNVVTSFGPPTSLTNLNTTAAFEQQPFVSGDGETLCFDRTPVGGSTSILCAIAGPTGFTNESALPELSPAATNSMRPVMSADGLTIFFSSDRAGGLGSLDIWTATRPSLAAPFEQITNLVALNSDSFEFPDWISEDGCRIYFSSGRGANADIWEATRPRS